MTTRGKKRVTRAQRVELGFLEAVRRRCPGNPFVLKPLGDLYTRVGRVDDGLSVDLELTTMLR